MSDDCKAAMLEAGVPYPCAPDCPCALGIENKALRAENARLDKACVEWADVSQANYQRAKAAEAESERLRYVLAGVRGAILTGRNEPLSIWKDQIDIALETKKAPGD